MTTVPAITMRIAQTMAKTTRRMKKSTKPTSVACVARAGRLGGVCHDGRAVTELLDLRDNDLVTGLEPAHDRVGAVVHFTQRDWDLMGDRTARAGNGDEREVLASLPRDGERRHTDASVRLPHYAGADNLRRAQLPAVREPGLDEDRLRLRVRLLGYKRDGRLGQRGVGGPVVAEQHDATRVVEQAELFRWNIDVGLERPIVVHARQLGLRANVVSLLYRNIA